MNNFKCKIIGLVILVSITPLDYLLAKNRQTLTSEALRENIFIFFNSNTVKNIDWAAEFAFLDTGEILFAKNEEKLLNPASIMKLITSYAALKTLGREYRFKTKIYLDEIDPQGTVHGNMVVKGGGDPTLQLSDLWSLVRMMKMKGLKSITGDIVYDESFFDSERKMSKDFDSFEAYNNSLGALSVNGNLLSVYSFARNDHGAVPRIEFEPEQAFVRIRDEAKSFSGKRSNHNGYYLILEPGDGYDTLIVKGEMKAGSSRSDWVTVSQPALYTCAVISELLRREGIAFNGRTVSGTAPKGAKLFKTLVSDPLSLIIQEMNKQSNNFVAEQVLKTMGGVFFGPPGSSEKGNQVIKSLLRTLGITGDFVFENGSGLSKKTRVSADLLIRLLNNAYHDPEVNHEFMASLGIFGIDGTVRRRPANGFIRAKTGTISDVSCLVGVATTIDKRPIAFSMLFNAIHGKYDAVKILQDKICSLIVRTKTR